MKAIRINGATSQITLIFHSESTMITLHEGIIFYLIYSISSVDLHSFYNYTIWAICIFSTAKFLYGIIMGSTLTCIDWMHLLGVSSFIPQSVSLAFVSFLYCQELPSKGFKEDVYQLMPQPF